MPRQLSAVVTLVLLAGCQPEPTPDLLPFIQPVVPQETISLHFPDADIHQILDAVGSYFGLKLDLPRKLNGRTSLQLHEVTWSQIFQVVLSPIDYDFYEENGTVFVRTKEEIASLPPVSKTAELKHLPPLETAAYLNRRYRGSVTFTPTEQGVAYTVSHKALQTVEDEIRRIDSPDTILNRFPKKPRLPAELPPLTLAPLQPWEIGSATNNAFSTEIFLFEHIDAELAAPFLERAASDKSARVVFDVSINALIVTAPESRRRKLEAIVAYLDDVRWYESESDTLVR